MKEKIKPSKIFYYISGAILVLGISFFIYFLITGIFSSVNGLNNRVIVPSTKTIELQEYGRYSIFFEYKSNIDGKVFMTNSINGLMCTLKNIETGEVIELNNSTVNSHYSVSGREGTSIFDFTIKDAGKYEFKSWYESGIGEDAVLAIGKGFGTNVLKTVILSICSLMIGIGLSLAIFIITLVKRKNAKRFIYQGNSLN